MAWKEEEEVQMRIKQQRLMAWKTEKVQLRLVVWRPERLKRCRGAEEDGVEEANNVVAQKRSKV